MPPPQSHLSKGTIRALARDSAMTHLRLPAALARLMELMELSAVRGIVPRDNSNSRVINVSVRAPVGARLH